MKKPQFIQRFQDVWKTFWKSEIPGGIIIIGTLVAFIACIIWIPHSEILRKTVTEKSSHTSGSITITVECTCHWSCEYDPYVVFVNHNDRDVTITISSKTSQDGYPYAYTKIDMFILKSGQQITKYVGCDFYEQLYTIEAIIISNQGTAETIRLWN